LAVIHNGNPEYMNRRFTRMLRFGKGWSARRSKGEMTDTSRERDAADTPQDVSSVRAKSDRHGKVTADKWNQ
jgi:hypothetical protein